jgi:hypothetical protein
MPNRSDDAVRNRWHRLMNSPMHSALGVYSSTTEGTTEYGRVVAYRCSRCGQPKKRHQCTAPPPDPEEEALLVAAKAGAKGKMERERGLGLEADGNAVGSGNEGRYGWTREEDETILNAVLELGHKWVQVAARLPGRTEHATRNRYHRLTSREYSGMVGPDYASQSRASEFRLSDERQLLCPGSLFAADSWV